jgi:hypothetical protein
MVHGHEALFTQIWESSGKMVTTRSSAKNNQKMVTTCSSAINNPKKGGRQQSPILAEVTVASKEPNTDTTQPLATPAKAFMAKEIRKQLKGVRQPKFGETKKVLSDLEKHLMQKINRLEGKIREIEKNLPEDLEWCRRITSNEWRRHCYGKYKLFKNETIKKHDRKVAMIRREIEELSVGFD